MKECERVILIVKTPLGKKKNAVENVSWRRKRACHNLYYGVFENQPNHEWEGRSRNYIPLNSVIVPGPTAPSAAQPKHRYSRYPNRF